jgi:hypothetical protein
VRDAHHGSALWHEARLPQVRCGQHVSIAWTERRAFACASCGDHVYPTAGTVFEDTRTPLQLWFYAIYLFVTTRHGVSGKELQRQLGVTYKTAWRMGMKIRELIGRLIASKCWPVTSRLDEAYVGGRRSGGKRGRGAEGKTVVMGMKERGGKHAHRSHSERQDGYAAQCGAAQCRAGFCRLHRRTDELRLTRLAMATSTVA